MLQPFFNNFVIVPFWIGKIRSSIAPSSSYYPLPHLTLQVEANDYNDTDDDNEDDEKIYCLCPP